MSDILLGSFIFVLIILALSVIVIAARAVLLPDHDVTVTVNGSKRFPARSSRKLLGILHEAGISLPSPCGGIGSCGLCRVTLISGGGELLSTELNKLSRRDVREGLRLACQVTARQDLAVEIPDDLFGVETWECTVRSNRSVAPFIRELVMELPANAELTFRAGSFVQVTAPAFVLPFSNIQVPENHNEIWERYGLRDIILRNTAPVIRAYSLANTPADQGTVVLNVRLALPPPGAADAHPGVVSSYLFAAKPGDQLAVSGPYGSFRAKDSDREMIFIGGGVGMAPLRAILFEQLEKEKSSRTMSFWYGARSPIEVFYADQFDNLQARHPNFTWTVALSDVRAEENRPEPLGFIHNVVLERYLKTHPAPEECEYYLCGPPLMISAVLAMLDDLGVERGNIFNDDFGS
jgi:Na+-transporting NADH:ubiquinone oxidoreductase subunit F